MAAKTDQWLLLTTHRLLSSSFLGLPCGILNINPKKELLRSLWVVESHVLLGFRGEGFRG